MNVRHGDRKLRTREDKKVLSTAVEGLSDGTSDQRIRLSVLQDVQPQECSLTTVQRRKLQYFGHVILARHLCSEMLEGRVIGNGANQGEDGLMTSTEQ